MGDIIVFGIITSVCTIGAAWSIGHTISIRTRWPKVQAEIVRYRITRGDGGKGQKFFHPVYRFTTLDGQRRIGLSFWGSWRRPWPLGQWVLVRYCPTNPRRTKVQCFATDWGLVLTLIALAIFPWAVFYWIPSYLGLPARG